MASSPGDQGVPVDALNSLVASAVALLHQLEASLVEPPIADPSGDSRAACSGPTTETPSDIDPLALARDAASLVRAHSTKISLFIINEPFTPSAISKIVSELLAGPVPGLASAAQAVDPLRYTEVGRSALGWKCAVVLKELRLLLLRIPKDGRVLSEKEKTGSGLAGGNGSIAATGTLWAACDEVVRFTKLGIAGFLVGLVEERRDTLQDVLEELREWGEEAGGDGDEDFDNEYATEQDVGNPHASTQAMLDDLMSSHQNIPSDDPNKIRERLDSCLRRLRLTTLLYQAIIKRRLKNLPALPAKKGSTIPLRLDEVNTILKRIPERFGDLAAAFYDLRADEIDGLMDQCFFDAFAASELLMESWDGQRDAFTDWAEKFRVEIRKA